MQFSAGVNLNYFYDKAINKQFNEIDKFLNNFNSHFTNYNTQNFVNNLALQA